MSILYTKKQAASYLSISLRTLETMMHDGTGPSFMRLDKRMIRFRGTDLDAWLTEPPNTDSGVRLSERLGRHEEHSVGQAP